MRRYAPKTTLAFIASALGQAHIATKDMNMKADYQGLIAVLGAASLGLCGWGLLLFELGERLHCPVMI